MLGRDEPQFELFDVGVFEEDRSFDVVVECANSSPDDRLSQVLAGCPVLTMNRSTEHVRL